MRCASAQASLVSHERKILPGRPQPENSCILSKLPIGLVLTTIRGYVLMNIVVVIATRGRPEEVSQAVTLLKRQTLAPSAVILSVEKASDVGKLIDDPLLTVIFGIPGLCAQRNRALDALPPNTDLVAFFDDDYLPTPKALEGAAALFRTYSD